MTALSYAVQCGHQRAINCLVEHGANPNYKDMFGNTLLHFGVTNCDTFTYQNLIKAVNNINARGLENKTALDYAINYNRKDLICLLRANGAKNISRT